MKARYHIALGILCLAGTATIHGLELEGVGGKILLDGRLRMELAEITDLEQSEAITYRLRLGYETSLSEWATFLAEGEGTMDVGMGDYDAYPGSQGEPGHAVIADPQNLELNRIQMSFNLDPVQAVVGRQRIIRNNARFVGNVGWRQNEQTFDAIGLSYSPADQLNLYYAYMGSAIRIFGARADVGAQKRFEMESHIIEAQFDIGNGIKAGAYGYLLGIENAAANSSDTIGIWATGTNNLEQDGLSVNWRAEFAEQTDNKHSPAGADFDLGYYHLTAGVTKKGVGGLTLGYEVLEGDGSRGFSTPLATLHAFNGFADAFLSTPSSGLADLYIKAAVPVADGITAAFFYHDFEADQGGASYGKEFDAVCSWKINANLSATAKVAYFDGTTRPNIARIWLQLDMKY